MKISTTRRGGKEIAVVMRKTEWLSAVQFLRITKFACLFKLHAIISNTLLVTQTDINGEMFVHGSLSLLCSNSTTWLLVRVVHELPAEGNIQASTFWEKHRTTIVSANQLIN